MKIYQNLVDKKDTLAVIGLGYVGLPIALEFAKKWGRGIDDATNRKFVTMYVNERTIDYRADGRESIRQFLAEGQAIGLIDSAFDPMSMKFIGAVE